MRRRIEWLGLGLSLALATLIAGPDASAADPVKKESIGFSKTYEILGQLPMMHEGRIKPIDTVARQEIKSIYTRESIKVMSQDGQTVSTWSPVAAFFDWSVRPKFWDAQPIIAVEWLPLKRFILHEEIKTALEGLSAKAAMSESDRSRIKKVVALEEIDAASLRDLVRNGKLAESDAIIIENLANKVGEETKWLSPDDLEDAQVTSEGKLVPFVEWLDALTSRSQGAGSMRSGKPKLSDLEQKAFDVGMMLAHYRAIRDHSLMSPVPLLVTPHPASQATLNYTAEAYKKAEDQGPRSLAPLELEAANTLHKYLNDLPSKDRAMPGTDPAFDANYTRWLKEKSAWVPLSVIQEVSIDELSKAGFPGPKVEAFRVALKKMEDEELARPGHAEIEPAVALISASKDLGQSINADFYPTTGSMALEVHFNELAPFFKAPIAYGLATFLLVMSLIVANFGLSMNIEGVAGKLVKALYLLGIVAFSCGIGLEAYGFYLRVRISGWAPVSNMYETVIWVGLVSAVLGLILEAVYKKTFAAMAGAGIAMVCTGLAATVPILDPNIPQLPPVLRSNYWLTIHVLTIVSSYAAFALAMGLGVAATTLYLTATYKRSPNPVELLLPLIPGLPLLVGGWYGVDKFYNPAGSTAFAQAYMFWLTLGIAAIGGMMVSAAIFGVIGELVNRAIFREPPSLDDSAIGGPSSVPRLDDRPSNSFSSGGVAVMELAGASVALAPRPKTEARALAMQSTAVKVKVLSSFIYRSMQVGILLVATGTFLGGWWADVSWGRFWGWDPKEVWALITLLVYLIPLHGRFAGWVNTFWLVMASVACFCSVLMAWYGVNFVLGVGMHSYGAGAGGQKPVLIATVVILGFAAGAYWRRRQSSLQVA